MACLQGICRFTRLKHYATLVRNITSNSVPVISTTTIPQVSLINSPITTQVSSTNNFWIWRKNDKVESPILNRIQVDFPNGLKYVPPLQDPNEKKQIQLPATIDTDVPKEAARLIIIRRNKMKRHKLKKLRKRMKYEWAKRRQRREWNKEKVFQAMLIKQCKEGEGFSAEKYVEERLSRMHEIAKEKSKVRKFGVKDNQM